MKVEKKRKLQMSSLSLSRFVCGVSQQIQQISPPTRFLGFCDRERR
jgi:hypothetical protein